MTQLALPATHLLAMPTLPYGLNISPALAALVSATCALLVGLRVRRGQRHHRDQQRRPSAAVITAAIAALLCTAYSADTSWRFAAHYLDMRNTAERTAMFAATELALFAMALMARQNFHGPQRAAGLPGVLVWVITAAQVIPAYAEFGAVGGTMRAFTGPIMAAVLWHLAMGIELRHRTPDAASRGLATVLTRQARERLLARLGIIEQDQGAAQIIHERAMRRAVSLAAHLAEMTPEKRTGWTGKRIARRLSKALARTGIDDDPQQNERLLRQLATRRQAAALATIEMPPRWHTPTPHTAGSRARPRSPSPKRAPNGPRPHPVDTGDEEPHRVAGRPQSPRPDPEGHFGPGPVARPEQGVPPGEDSGPIPGGRAEADAGKATGARKKRPGRKPKVPDDLVLEYVHRLHQEGRLARDTLEDAMRDDEHPIGSDRAGAIVRAFKAELNATDSHQPR